MTSEKIYFCSSPAIDWRLSGNNTIDALLQPDPLIYSSPASLEQLYRYVDTTKGLGAVPHPPKKIPKKERKDVSARTMSSPTQPKKGMVDFDGLPVTYYRVPTPQPATPTKARTLVSSTASPSPSPSSKRKRANEGAAVSPSDRGRGSKWLDWEDQMIKDSIVAVGEKNTDWHAILKQINARRSAEEQRTLNSLKLHWLKPLKGKMLDS
jgi:hypothetical protein